MSEFTEWLDGELNRRDWSRADLARRSGVNQSSLSMIYSGQRKPGVDICLAIAQGLKLSAEEVYRAAGLLPELPTMDEAMREILEYKLGELTLAQREEVLRFIEFIRERDEDREGATPPDRLRRRVRT